MRTNPFLDSFKYMFAFVSWTTVAFDLLLLAGILLIAIWIYRRYPEQRTPFQVWTWVARTVMGAMWWQQVIWKTPPDFDGLRFWTNEMVKYASTDLQRGFVTKVILAHFDFFAPQVFLVEVIISVARHRVSIVRLASGRGSMCSSSSSWSSSARSRLDAVSAWTCSWPTGTAVTSARYLVCYDGCVKAQNPP